MLCTLTFRGKLRNISVISFYAPTEEKRDVDKNLFYNQKEGLASQISNCDLKICVGDDNTKAGKEPIWRKVAGRTSLYDDVSSSSSFIAQKYSIET